VIRRLDPDRARRLALAAQGFAAARPAGRVDVRHVRRVLGRVGLLQIDSVNVVERAHLLTLFARLGPFDPEIFRRAVEERRELFEYWGHEASFLPVDAWPLLRHRMARRRVWGSVRALADERPGYVESVLTEVREKGPLRPADLSDPGDRRAGAWWDWKAGKLALEWLFAGGEVTVSHRGAGFVRYYDLPERVIPQPHRDAPSPGREGAQRQLVRRAIAAMGVATARDLADYFRMPIREGRAAVTALADAGVLERVAVPGWRDDAFVDPAATIPRRVEACALVCPFDSLIWQRERVERLFGFHYRVEIYVPRPQRRWGYYVLPFLLGDRLVARVDAKADRGRRVLRVPAAHIEDGEDPGRVAPPLAAELERMAGWLGLGDVVVARRGNLAGELGRRLG
jgi:uncharacterized protein YcaQ